MLVRIFVSHKLLEKIFFSTLRGEFIIFRRFLKLRLLFFLVFNIDLQEDAKLCRVGADSQMPSTSSTQKQPSSCSEKGLQKQNRTKGEFFLNFVEKTWHFVLR